jgi:alkylation response protein AidB-like acyl-CoA dehydrogenase
VEYDVSAILADLTTTAEGTAREHAAAVDRDRAFPRATIEALANGGALGLMVPEAFGGAGGLGAGRQADKPVRPRSPVLTEALTRMAARSSQPAEIGEAAAEVRALDVTMDENRRRRLRAAGFDDGTARHLSELHTPNLM